MDNDEVWVEFKFDRERVLRITRTQLEGRVLRNIEVSPPVAVDKQENRGTLLSDNQTDKED